MCTHICHTNVLDFKCMSDFEMLLPMWQSAFALIIPHNKQVQNLSGLITSMYFFLMSHPWLVVANLGLAPDWNSDLCVLHPSLLPEPRLREYHSPERSSCHVASAQEGKWKHTVPSKTALHWCACSSKHISLIKAGHVTKSKISGAGNCNPHGKYKERAEFFLMKLPNLHTLKTKLWSFAADT